MLTGARRRVHDDLIRWAKLDPLLADVNLSPYLHLATSFSGDLLVSDELPQRLRDVAAQLTVTGPIGSTTADQQALRVPVDDAGTLIRYFSRLGSRQHPGAARRSRRHRPARGRPPVADGRRALTKESSASRPRTSRSAPPSTSGASSSTASMPSSPTSLPEHPAQQRTH